MQGMIYGRLVGIIFLILGLFLLGLEYYMVTEQGSYSTVMALGLVLLFVCPVIIIWPGPTDIRFDSSDDYADRQAKGHAWSDAIRQQPRLLRLYGAAVAVGFCMFIYADLYLQEEVITVWAVALRVGIALLITWWLFSRSKNRDS